MLRECPILMLQSCPCKQKTARRSVLSHRQDTRCWRKRNHLLCQWILCQQLYREEQFQPITKRRSKAREPSFQLHSDWLPQPNLTGVWKAASEVRQPDIGDRAILFESATPKGTSLGLVRRKEAKLSRRPSSHN